MKKIVLLALAITLTSVGVGFAMNAMHQIQDHGKCETGYKCMFCKGTGWGENGRKCFSCNGTGANSAY